jgi:hypothetical protein
VACEKDEANTQKESKPTQNIGLIDTLSIFTPPGNAIHIDPTASDSKNEDGSVEHPYNSFNDFKFVANSTYALKRGTTISTDFININVDGVTLCSYGESGQRPIIKSIARDQHAILTHWSGPSDVTIRDIEVNAPNANSCIRFGGNGDNLKVINCLLHGAYWEFRAIGATNILVYNTEMHSANDDGMFLQYCENIEISNCYVHNVNLNWKPPSTPESEAGGDGIQFDKCNHWHVHHNEIDRTNSGNKFCFISNNREQDDGVFEYNYCITSDYPVTGVYLGSGENLIVRYNYISSPGGSPVYSHSSNLLVHHNIFNNIGSPLFSSRTSEIYNNLIKNFTLAIQGEDLKVVNNIFVPNQEEYWIFKVSKLTASNNLMNNEVENDGIINGNPVFIDEDNSNFHLSETSDCIDAGILVGVDYDFDGTPIPQGTAPDIGPYEYIE